MGKWFEGKATTKELVDATRPKSDEKTDLLVRALEQAASDGLRERLTGHVIPSAAVSLRTTDITVLFRRLEDFFPDEQYDMDKAELYRPAAKSIPRSARLEQICNDAMNLALASMDDALSDIEKKQREGASMDELERYIAFQGHYLIAELFWLPRVYRLVATLDQRRQMGNPNTLPADWRESFFKKGTDQSHWRDQYNERSRRFFKIVQPIIDEKKFSEVRLLKWFAPDDSQRIIARPDSLPTGSV